MAECHSYYSRMSTLRKMPIQVHASLLKNQMLPNIVPAKYTSSTITALWLIRSLFMWKPMINNGNK